METLRKMSSGKPTVGLLCTKLTDLNYDIYRGCVTGAENADCNLVVFNGEFIASVDDHTKNDPNAIAFDFASPDVLDGLVVYSGSIGQFLAPEEMVRFCKKFEGIPVVSIAQEVTGHPSVIVDNYSGIYQVVHHLTDVHNLTKIAFIKGPDGHPEAEERLKAYQDALKERGIDLGKEYLAPGDFSPEAGLAGVKLFLDQRRLDIEAIVCVDDDTAAGVLDALHSRNISIPDKIVVTGFDDVPETMAMDPPLTTVNQPFQKISEHAVSLVMELIRGRGVDSIIKIPTDLQVRQSCGCMNQIVKGAGTACADDDFHSVDTHRGIAHAIIRRLGKLPDGITEDTVVNMIHSIDKDVGDKKGAYFVQELNHAISSITKSGGGIENLHTVLSAVRFALKNELGCDEWLQAEDLFQQGRVQIHNSAYRKQVMETYDIQNEYAQLSQTIQSMTMTEDLKSLWEILKDRLPPVGITHCCIYKYVDPQHPLKGAESIFSFPASADRNVILNPRQISTSFFSRSRRFSLIMSPLVFGNEHIGYGVWEIDPDKASNIDTLSLQLSGILKRLTMMEIKDQEDQHLRDRNAMIQGQVSPMLDSIGQVSGITQEKIAALKSLVEMVVKGSEEMAENHTTIRQINQDARYMLETLRVIDDIAESVNVLAINASIESTHAGSFGKGFSVIAKEIRRLSDSTAQNSNEISTRLNETVRNISGFVGSIEKNMESFNKISERVNEYLRSMEEISNTMKDLESNSARILEIMEE